MICPNCKWENTLKGDWKHCPICMEEYPLDKQSVLTYNGDMETNVSGGYDFTHEEWLDEKGNVLPHQDPVEL